ncbi:MAG TPA: hypothetical protein V6D29_08225 [Leptolyngbyaceae cyanobacterium]
MTVPRTVCLGFLVMIVLGILLLMLPLSTQSGTWNHPLVALFTATSAVCVTGLVVVDTGTHFSPVGQGFILALIQLGGLGYMTATTFLLLILGLLFETVSAFATIGLSANITPKLSPISQGLIICTMYVGSLRSAAPDSDTPKRA